MWVELRAVQKMVSGKIGVWGGQILPKYNGPAAQGNRAVVHGQIFGRLCVADLGHCLYALGSGGGLADGLVGIICYGRKKALSYLGALG